LSFDEQAQYRLKCVSSSASCNANRAKSYYQLIGVEQIGDGGDVAGHWR